MSCPRVFKDKLYQPSVTGIIGMLDKSGALVSWAVGQMAERMTQLANTSESWDRDSLIAVIDVAKDTWRKTKGQAADIGTIAHGVLEKKLLGEDVDLPLTVSSSIAPGISQDMIDQANNAVDAGMQFFRENEIEVVQTEGTRWSPTYGFIGTGDLVAKINGKLSILDWKTSKRLYPTVKLQLGAYAQAWEEEFPDQPIEQGVAVNIGKDGKLTVETYSAEVLQADFKIFLSLLNVWRWNRVNQSDAKWNKPVPRQLTPEEIEQLLDTAVLA